MKILILVRKPLPVSRKHGLTQAQAQAQAQVVCHMILRNSGQSEIIRVCMGIFTICFRKHKYYKILNKNTLSCFHGVLLAGCALTFPICDDFCEF